ncbi:E3 ubiquitin-protein ligase BIG BROTHER-like [Andrographis paniculata]|uniref:E3 ubiquitin-protein ligase BIG BROTHER-like n=1 Tax=Andrographis paniculata TaxID=175694 RepID=UPI0021E8586A|nr:E3 ubiquitin-protein ligase BIG BROTHER-like [Andrographis paniculata]XP_051142258.1 E3 ubiquitin-protein ligase BIG BROTHER-like [Andrographis paniculata]
MSWNPPVEVQYQNNSLPYNSIGSFVDFLEVFTYDHVNYIFADTNYTQENAYSSYPATNASSYKFAVSEPGSLSYYEYGNGYVVDNQIPSSDDYSRQMEPPFVVADDRATASTVFQEGNSRSTSHARPIECPRNHQDVRDNEVVWQDGIDPDNMTYEELLELGEAVGTQNRGLSQAQIAMLPISKFKYGLFSRKKFRGERCVICQMEYRRGDKRITLPCKHIYHTDCGGRWLSINKACPICYKEVIIDAPKH